MFNRNQNSSNILRVVAGLYLLYLAYQLFKDGILNGEMVGTMRIVGIAAMAVFFVTGVILTGSFIKSQLKPAEEPEDAEEMKKPSAAEAQEDAEETTDGNSAAEENSAADDACGDDTDSVSGL